MTTEEARKHFGAAYSFETLMSMLDVGIIIENNNNGIFSGETAARLTIGRFSLEMRLAAGGDMKRPDYYPEYVVVRKNENGEWEQYRVADRRTEFNAEGIEQRMLDVLRVFAGAEGLILEDYM